MQTEMRRVLDVGQCDLDHGNIQRLLEQHFKVQVDRARRIDEALDCLKSHKYHLVLVNRLLDADGNPGLDLVRRIKADPELHDVPIMLVSNFPDAQQQAVAAGAVPGFGKAALGSPATRSALGRFLSG